MSTSIYDNSNLAESYSGTTTPLTYSFARYVYQGAYKHFCRMMGVSNRVIKKHDFMFANMVAFIGYHMYYNLVNWYLMISLFPGYQFSREFMENMMGVEKEYRDLNKEEQTFFKKYFLYLPKALTQSVKITFSFISLGGRIKQFNRYFDKTYKELRKIDLNTLSLQELKQLYDELDRKLIASWKVPIANDFAVMVSAGLSDKFFKKWLGSNNAYSYMYRNTRSSLVTLDPGLSMLDIAKSIRDDECILGIFKENDEAETILDQLTNNFSSNETVKKIFRYLKDFGDRAPNELKLESKTLGENPGIFVYILKNLIENDVRLVNNSKRQDIKDNEYYELGLRKRIFLRWLLKWAGNSIQRREETRFRRALIFGYIRKIFFNIGNKLEEAGAIKSSRDVFFLTVSEVFDCIDKKRHVDDLMPIIAKRQEESSKWKDKDLPRRIETNDKIENWESKFLKDHKSSKLKSRKFLHGMVASKPYGLETISGLSVTLEDFNPKVDFENRILVTKQTDPGWTIIFPLLKAIVVERGGMLSHAAIVARELNIPCIIGVNNATDLIKSESEIHLNLKEGLIDIHK